MRLAGLALAAGVVVSACTTRGPGVAVERSPTPPASRAAPPAVLPDDPPAVPGEASLEGFRAPGDARPATQTVRFDVDALPVATWGAAWRGAGFSLRRIRDGWHLWVRTTIFAEVIVTASGTAGEKGTHSVGFSGFTGGSFGEGEVPACGRGSSGQRLAVWNGFAPAGWTDGGIDVEMEEGDYDLATCSGTPVRSLRGRASALVPGYVYAVRAREEDDDGKGRESLVVFMPRGALVSTAADPTTPLEASNTGAFTRLTFPLARGTAGSANVRLSPASLALWARLRQTRAPVMTFEDPSPAHEDLLVGIDVAWQGEAPLGSVSLALPKAKAKDARAYAGLLAAAKKREL